MAYCQTCKTKYWCCWSPKTCKCANAKLLDEKQIRVQQEQKIVEAMANIKAITQDVVVPKTKKHQFDWIGNWSKCINCWTYRFYSAKPCI